MRDVTVALSSFWYTVYVRIQSKCWVLHERKLLVGLVIQEKPFKVLPSSRTRRKKTAIIEIMAHVFILSLLQGFYSVTLCC